MSTTEEKQQSLTPEQIPFTTPEVMSRYVTDTGKILRRKYTGLSAKQQRAITRTLKHSRNMLLAKLASGPKHPFSAGASLLRPFL